MMMPATADVSLELHGRQSVAFRSEATEILYGGAAGGGKALALDTPIPTPDGWITMGDLSVGDAVFDENGQACRVIAATVVMRGRPCYRVALSDGGSIVADAGHQWLTFDLNEREALRRRTPEFRANRRQRRPRRGTGARPDLVERNTGAEHDTLGAPTGTVRTTAEMAESVTHRGRTNHAIRVCPGLSLPDADLLVDPYVMGAWLGDGTSSQAAITTADPEILVEIGRRGYTVTDRTSVYAYGILGLLDGLRESGVLNNKHIPRAYLRGSEAQRLDLLRGLMDTDGTALPAGGCEFYTTSPALAEGVRELLVSLGIKANVREARAMLDGRDCGPKYRIKFTTSRPVFTLERKAERQPDSERGVQDWRIVTAVEPVESVPVRCIQVDSGSSLFLAGAGMVPTHNSHLMRVAAIAWCVAIPGLQVYLFRRTSPDLLKNHMEGPGSFPALMAPWLESGQASINYSKNHIDIGTSRIHLCHCQYEKDVYKYQGAEIHVLMLDELTHFTRSQYVFLRSRVRLGGLDMPDAMRGLFPRVVAASNPGGVGHNWVKAMFVDPAPALARWKAPKSDGGMLRQFIPALLRHNPTLTKNDPDYEERLHGLGNDALVRAMLKGDWDIVSGGMFDDVWDRDIHTVEPFDIPASWYVDRSFDWGSSKPFSAGWWAEADGTEVVLKGGKKWAPPRGTLFRIGEWYGWNGKPNEGKKLAAKDIAAGIVKAEKAMGIRSRVKAGPGDFPTPAPDEVSMRDTFKAAGAEFTEPRKASGSRENGWQAMRDRLTASMQKPMEAPGLFVFNTCTDGFIRTVPTLPRSERKPDDVDTDAEDHPADESRYRITAPKPGKTENFDWRLV